MSDWLLGTLLATSGLAVLVLLVREPVRKRFGARVTYGLWLIPAARLFMPTLRHTVERAIPVQTAALPLGMPLAREPIWMARVAPADPSLADQLGGWPTILLAIWLGGAAALFLSRLLAFHRDRRAILASSVQLAQLGSVRIVRTPEVESPVALGILDRIIAVPADFDRRYADRERRLVLEHELAHHRSGDLVANLFAFVLLCLQWFNPLAWAAHAAFRFDQEAACDARVLDKVNADGRADYGRAIAKAASGRALLFASALDRRNSLHRRLQSMLHNPHPGRRIVGRLIVFSAIAVALPLTASHAIDYVDTPVPVAAPTPATATVPATAAVPVTATAAVAVVPPVHRAVLPAAAVAVQAPVQAAGAPRHVVYDGMQIDEDHVIIDGKSKRWEDLTPAERDRVRRAVAEARASLANVHINSDQIARQVSQAMSNVRIGDIQRDVAQAQANAAAAMRGIDPNDTYIRAVGRDPKQIEIDVGRSLRSVQAIDVEAIRRQLAAIDPAKLAKTMSDSQEALRAASAQLDRIQVRIDSDQHH